MNHSPAEIIDQFRAAMQAAGIEPPAHIIANGQLQRFKIDGKLNGRYKLFLDGRPAGFFQDYKQGIKENWKFEGEIRVYTAEEKRAFALHKAEQERKRLAEETARHQNAASLAAQIWAKAKPVDEHSYLSAKRLKSAYGARLYNKALVIPLYAENHRLMSLEFIHEDSTKRFLKGGKKAGCFWWIGTKTERVLIAEGYATAATLHEHTGLQVLIAFDAGNLLKVAQILRIKRPEVEIIVCADNDASGTGQHAAEEAALAVDGRVCMPPEVGLDYNDWAIALSQGGA